MLILSRRENEKVLFPTLGICVEVLRVRGNATRLGIDAPADIPILRHEIARERTLEMTPDTGDARRQVCDLAQVVRRRLDGAATILNQLHRRLETCRDPAGQQIVVNLFRELDSLEREAHRALEGSTDHKAISVLVVEDSTVERRLLAYVLELSGMNVTTARDGQEALEFLSMHAWPDAVLLDMRMPRCDGPMFVEQLRRKPEFKSLRIFAVSSLDPGELGLETGPDGIAGWFPKPVEPSRLVSVLSQELGDSGTPESAATAAS